MDGWAAKVRATSQRHSRALRTPRRLMGARAHQRQIGSVDDCRKLYNLGRDVGKGLAMVGYRSLGQFWQLDR